MAAERAIVGIPLASHYHDHASVAQLLGDVGNNDDEADEGEMRE